MAKSDSNVNNNKARSNKPYDASNSFVKKVASRVSGFIPQSTSWLSGWFSPSDPDQGSLSKERRDQLPTEDDDFHDAFEQPPPAKRFRLADNQQFSLESYNRGTPISQSESCSRRLQNEFTDMSAMPGPSGLEARSGGFAASTPAMTAMGHQETKTNGGECSESGESTSGCSSLEPQINRGLPSTQSSSQVRQHDSSPRKHLMEDKMNYSFMQNSRSLFLDRSMNSRHNQSVGRRNKPSFCVNTFGSPLFGDKSSLNDLIVNSPFYAGRTTFGGASSSSYRRSIGSASVSSSPANSDKLARHTIKVKSSHSTSAVDTSMSQTARRILATLEQFSTPVLDAKRIPVSPRDPAGDNSGSRKRSRLDDCEEPRLVLEQARTPARSHNRTLHWAGGPPSTTKLTVPVIPDTLVLKRRERLQDSTTAARLMASSAAVTNMTCGLESYKLRSESESNKAKHSLKMKPPSKTRQERDHKEPESAEEVNLPKIPLPISSLPTFDISVPPPKSVTHKSSASQISQVAASSSKSPFSLTSSSVPTTSSLSSISVQSFTPKPAISDSTFSFSSPIRVSPKLKDKSLPSISNFSFSSPLPAVAKPSEDLSNCVSAESKVKDSALLSCGIKPASELKTGSVMDILGKKGADSSVSFAKNSNEGASLREKFKPAAGSWECDKCMIRNKSELARCAACTNPRESNEPKATTSIPTSTTISTSVNTINHSSGFGSQFKLSSGMWECSACMVRNKDSDEQCVACTSPKPGGKKTSEALTPKPVQTVASISGWGDKFKPASDTWECGTCMLRNVGELEACQACTAKKPRSSSTGATAIPKLQSSWGDKFKKPEGSWQCGDCLIDNKPADLKCVACQAKKPGSESLPPSPALTSAPKFSFGVPPASTGAASSLSFTFGVPKEKTESEESKATVTSSTGFKFGDKSGAAPPTSFTFGVPVSTPSSASTNIIAVPVAVTTTVTTVTSVATPLTIPSASPVTTAPSLAAVMVASPSPPAVAAMPYAITQPITAAATTTSTSTPIVVPSLQESSTVSPVSSVVTKSLSPSVSTPSVQVTFKAPSLFGTTSSGNDSFKPVSKPADLFSTFKFEQSQASVSLTSPQPSSSSEGQNQASPAGGKRKHADDTPSSTAVPFKFGAVSQPDVVTPANVVCGSTSTSSVSSTSGPVFCFSASSGGSTLETSSAGVTPATNSPFSKLVSSPPSSSSSKLNPVFSIGKGSSKDESVTSTWKQTVSNSVTTTDTTTADSSVSSAVSKPIFRFGSVSSSGMSFGQPTSIPAPSFAFGTTSEKSATKPAPTFGASASNSQNSAFNTPGSANPVAASSFGLTPNTGFGSPAPSTNSSTIFNNSSAFGSNANAGATPAFGSFGSSSEEKKNPSLFSSASDEKKPTFSFGASAEEKKPFTFQASTTTQVSTFQTQPCTMFTFGSSATATNGPAKPEFSFGSSSTPTPFPTFNASQPSTSSSGFNFTPQPSSSVFGSVNNTAPTPLFGSTTPATGNTLFSSATPSGSTFGSSQPAAVFNFSAPGATGFGSQNQAPPAPFSFEPNVKPNFNFTSGSAVSFAATPSDGSSALTGRRIRKAMRRTTPR